MRPPYSRGLLRLKRTRRSPLRSQSHFAFIDAAAPATKSLVIVGFGAPVELDGNASYEGVRRFPELFPFFGFREPVFHFSFRNRSPLTAHAFLRSKIICCPHDASPLTTPLLCQRREEVGLTISINVPDFVIHNFILSLATESLLILREIILGC